MEKLIFEKSAKGRIGYTLPELEVENVSGNLSEKFRRKKIARLPQVSEIEVARHFQGLSHLNFNIESGMYPLGSCTMKYNPKVNEKVAGLSGFAGLHPLLSNEHTQGALRLLHELGECLKEITGLPGVSLQPVAGSQGELTGIYLFKAYHASRGDQKRNTILIPDSAHGTNPSSAAIAGMKIESVKSNQHGKIDLVDLKSKLGDHIAGFMVTNPSTVGIFESEIIEVQKAVSDCGGLMYMDGANLNALLSIVRPGDMNFDCMHINLHKTFSTPHGGGGPGAGPICVSERLIPFLPSPTVEKDGDEFRLEYNNPDSIGRVHAFFGNFGVLVRAYTYIRMLGAKGLRAVSENAVINANYLLARLKNDFDVPFEEHCMHEFILSGNRQKKIGVSTRDMAKRLLDYGFHAPTVYFPLVVPEAMLIEPTETENKQNLDGFADALIAIAREVENDPDKVLSAPHSSPVKRLDEAGANRNLNIRYDFS